MSAYQPTPDNPEAHPTRDEYVVERALNDGGWVVESIRPTPAAEEAEEQCAHLLHKYPQNTYRVVRRTIVSSVIGVRPGQEQS